MQDNPKPASSSHDIKPELVPGSNPTKDSQNNVDFVNSILEQDNDNILDFFDSVDPMLAWALLKSKILPQLGVFDFLLEKAKLRSSEDQQPSLEPSLCIQMILKEFDNLLQDLCKMLQSCGTISALDDPGLPMLTSERVEKIPLSTCLSFELLGIEQAMFQIKDVDKVLKYPALDFKVPLVKNEMNLEFNPEEDLEDPDEQDDDAAEREVEEEDDDNNEDLKDLDKALLENEDSDAALPKCKKRVPKTCEKCHKTYNTQTQFRIHQRVLPFVFPEKKSQV